VQYLVKMKNKKATHVETIFSFIFFITFISFLFLFLKYPSTLEENKKFSLEILENSIKNQTTEELIKIYITNSSPQNSEDCMFINDSSLNVSLLNYYGLDENDTTLDLKRETNFIYLEWLTNSSFFVIYYSKYNFTNHSLTNNLNCQEAIIKTVIKSEKIFEKNLLNLFEDYNQNYSYTRKQLNIPEKYEFNIQFKYENGTEIGKKINETKSDIYVKEISIEYLNDEIIEKKGVLKIYIW